MNKFFKLITFILGFIGDKVKFLLNPLTASFFVLNFFFLLIITSIDSVVVAEIHVLMSMILSYFLVMMNGKAKKDKAKMIEELKNKEKDSKKLLVG